jgi:hypothetical protein
VFIDAKTGDEVWSYDSLAHAPLDDTTHDTYDMGGSTSKNGKAKPFAQTGDQIAEDAHNFAGDALEYFAVEHDRASYDGAGAVVNSYVHYGNNYVNAFWDGNSLNYGDGDNVVSTALTTRDIVGHEFGHGVTDFSADLIYSNESGALNEATSDIFAAAIEAYKGGTPADAWHIGEDCWLDDPDPNDGIRAALRYMNDPAKAGDRDYYPDRYTGTQDGGGVHTNSGIANIFFVLLSDGGTHPRGKTAINVDGIGIQNAADIWYLALTSYMNASTDFEGARVATLLAASDLNSAWISSVEQAWDAVGVTGPIEYDTTLEEATNQSASSGTEATYGPYDGTGLQAVKFEIAGGNGDADLYVKFGSAPTTNSYDCRPYINGNSEVCEFNPPQDGNYYVMVRAYQAYSGLTFTASAAGGTPVPDCTVDSDCDDSDSCTLDVCNTGDGTCSNNDSGLCECVTDAECDDGDSCTTNTCLGNVCVAGNSGTCCTNNGGDAFCDDSDSCTADTCNANGTCTSADNGLCECVNDAGCDDGSTCTDDSCSANACSNVDNGTCYLCTAATESTDCDDGDPCTADTCSGANDTCDNTASGACTPEALNCADGVDNDLDTTTDCADPDCFSNPACSSGGAPGADCAKNSDCASGKCRTNGKKANTCTG